MEIGKLNQRIDVEENQVVVNDVGYAKNQWVKKFSCWSNVTVRNSTEDNTVAVPFDELVFQFVLRDTSGSKQITPTNFRIAFKGEYYSIQSIIMDYVKKDYIRLEAKLLKKGK